MREREDARVLAQVVKELELRSTITTAMLSTLDLEQILSMILSGITSDTCRQSWAPIPALLGCAIPRVWLRPRLGLGAQSSAKRVISSAADI